MRHVPLFTLVFLTVLSTLGCGFFHRDPPQAERSDTTFAHPEGVFKLLKPDLPWYGGMTENSSENYLNVSYAHEVSHEVLVREWPKALRDAGWKPKFEEVQPDGGFSGSYTLPDGRWATLGIDPEGTLWEVVIVLEADKDEGPPTCEQLSEDAQHVYEYFHGSRDRDKNR